MDSQSAGQLRATAAAVQERSAALIAAATVGLLGVSGRFDSRTRTKWNMLRMHIPIPSKVSNSGRTIFKRVDSLGQAGQGARGIGCGRQRRVIQHYPHYKETVHDTLTGS